MAASQVVENESAHHPAKWVQDAEGRACNRRWVIVALDNRYVEGSSTPMSHSDGEGNTYQRRRLSDGSEHTVLKNFPTEAQLREDLAGRAKDFQLTELEYYWLLRYRPAG